MLTLSIVLLAVCFTVIHGLTKDIEANRKIISNNKRMVRHGRSPYKYDSKAVPISFDAWLIGIRKLKEFTQDEWNDLPERDRDAIMSEYVQLSKERSIWINTLGLDEFNSDYKIPYPYPKLKRDEENNDVYTTDWMGATLKNGKRWIDQ